MRKRESWRNISESNVGNTKKMAKASISNQRSVMSMEAAMWRNRRRLAYIVWLAARIMKAYLQRRKTRKHAKISTPQRRSESESSGG
jgi:hypothetical protein